MPRKFKYDRTHDEKRARADRSIALGVYNDLQSIEVQVKHIMGNVHVGLSPVQATRHFLRLLDADKTSAGRGYRKLREKFSKQHRRHILRLAMLLHIRNQAEYATLIQGRFLSHCHKAYVQFVDAQAN